MTEASPRIARKRLKRKDAILEVALSEIAEAGLDGLTMQGLAHKLELTPGALYRYFDSKQAIFSALEARVLGAMSQRLGQTLEARSPTHDALGDALAQLWTCAEFYLQQRLDYPEQSRLISALLGDARHHVRDEDLALVGAQFFALFHRLVEVFEHAAEVGALSSGDSRERALVFWSALQGVCTIDKLARVEPKFFDPTNTGRALTQALLIGWGADAQRVLHHRKQMQ